MGSQAEGGCTLPRLLPRAHTVQSRGHRRAESGSRAFCSADSQEAALRPALGSTRALGEPGGGISGDGVLVRPGRVPWPPQRSWGGAEAQGLEWRPPRPLSAQSPGPFPWSRSAWPPAPRVPGGSRVQIHLPLAVAMLVILPVSSLSSGQPPTPPQERAEGAPSPSPLGPRQRKAHTRLQVMELEPLPRPEPPWSMSHHQLVGKMRN